MINQYLKNFNSSSIQNVQRKKILQDLEKLRSGGVFNKTGDYNIELNRRLLKINGDNLPLFRSVEIPRTSLTNEKTFNSLIMDLEIDVLTAYEELNNLTEVINLQNQINKSDIVKIEKLVTKLKNKMLTYKIISSNTDGFHSIYYNNFSEKKQNENFNNIEIDINSQSIKLESKYESRYNLTSIDKTKYPNEDIYTKDTPGMDVVNLINKSTKPWAELFLLPQSNSININGINTKGVLAVLRFKFLVPSKINRISFTPYSLYNINIPYIGYSKNSSSEYSHEDYFILSKDDISFSYNNKVKADIINFDPILASVIDIPIVQEHYETNIYYMNQSDYFDRSKWKDLLSNEINTTFSEINIKKDYYSKDLTEALDRIQDRLKKYDYVTQEDRIYEMSQEIVPGYNDFTTFLKNNYNIDITGKPLDKEFTRISLNEYILGLRNIEFTSVQFYNEGEYWSEEIDSNNGHITSIALEVNEEIPEGCSIEHYIYTGYSGLLPILPSNVTVVKNERIYPNFETLSYNTRFGNPNQIKSLNFYVNGVSLNKGVLHKEDIIKDDSGEYDPNTIYTLDYVPLQEIEIIDPSTGLILRQERNPYEIDLRKILNNNVAYRQLEIHREGTNKNNQIILNRYPYLQDIENARITDDIIIEDASTSLQDNKLGELNAAEYTITPILSWNNTRGESVSGTGVKYIPLVDSSGSLDEETRRMDIEVNYKIETSEEQLSDLGERISGFVVVRVDGKLAYNKSNYITGEIPSLDNYEIDREYQYYLDGKTLNFNTSIIGKEVKVYYNFLYDNIRYVAKFKNNNYINKGFTPILNSYTVKMRTSR